MPSEVGTGNNETSKSLGKSWASSAPRLLSVAFSICATLFFSRPLGAETCSSDIELLLDTLSPTDIAEICPSSKSEWTIGFDMDIDRWPSDFDGYGCRIATPSSEASDAEAIAWGVSLGVRGCGYRRSGPDRGGVPVFLHGSMGPLRTPLA